MKWLGFALAFLFTVVLAAPPIAADVPGDDGLKLVNAQMNRELRARAARIGAASNFDTTWVGFTPGHEDSRNYWSVYAGFGKDGFHRPPAEKGMWAWETRSTATPCRVGGHAAWRTPAPADRPATTGTVCGGRPIRATKPAT